MLGRTPVGPLAEVRARCRATTWQINWEASVSPAGLKKIFKSFERRVKGNYAVVGAVSAQKGIQLTWLREVTYSAAMVWVKKTMAEFPDCEVATGRRGGRSVA